MSKILKKAFAVLGIFSLALLLFFLFLPYGVYIEYQVKFNPVQAWSFVMTQAPIEYVINSSETDQGVTGNGRTVKAFLNAIGTTRKATIKVLHTSTSDYTDYTVSTALTITSNVAIEIDHGARLSDSGGSANLIINGPFNPDPYQVFDWTGSGSVAFGNGVLKEVYPEWWGAYQDGTNATATTAAFAACIVASGPSKIIGTASANYAINSSIPIAPLNNNTYYHARRVIDLRGALITISDTPASVFGVTSGAWPLNHRFLTIKNIRFTGAVTDCINLSGSNYWDINISGISYFGVGNATSIIHVYNNSGDAANPGNLTFEDITNNGANMLHAIKFSHAGAPSSNQFDDVRINRVYHVGTNTSSTCVLLDATFLAYSEVKNLIKCSAGYCARAINGGYFSKSTLELFYLEIGTETDPCYAIDSRIYWCDVSNIWVYMANHVTQDVKAIWAVWAKYSTFRQIGGYSVAAGDAPYATIFYPIIRFDATDNVTVEFPHDYIVNGVQLYAAGTHTGLRFTGGTKVTTKAFTAGATTYAVSLQENGTSFVNTGADAAGEFDLLAATKGYEYTFTRIASQTARIDPNGTETIRGGGAGKYLELDTDGDSVTIRCEVDGQWEIVGGYGTYAYEP